MHLCLVACLVLSVKWTADTVHFFFEVNISATVVGLIFSISTLLHPSFHSPRCGFPQQIYPCAFNRNMLPRNMHQCRKTCRIQPLENTNKEFQVVDIHTSERKMSCPIYCPILNDYSPIMHNCVCSDETLFIPSTTLQETFCSSRCAVL